MTPDDVLTQARTGTDPRPGVMARPLNPDLPSWEKQAKETPKAYAAFIAYRDSEKRRLADHGSTAREWSAQWQWQLRCLDWDRYMARVDAEELVRYRVTMNERHRAAARLAQARIITWLQGLDGEVLARMRPSEAARWFEVAVRIEREAAGAALPLGLPDHVTDASDPLSGMTLAEVLGVSLSASEEERLAADLHDAMRG